MWSLEFRLTPLERELLRCWPVRRLQFVAHAGAASLTTHQTYSRLEHSLGLLALVTHFAPHDEVARAAALLHDVGHLPFSHTFEGVGGLNHHDLGVQRIRELAPVLSQYQMGVDEVLAVESGDKSLLRGRRGALKLDHLESFVRSGRAHGRLTEAPSATLRQVELVDGEVHTDDATAKYLCDLALGEAEYLVSWENAVATAVVRGLAAIVLTDTAGIPELTDDEMWSVLLTDPRTRDDASALRHDPLGWEVYSADHAGRFPYEIHQLYLDTPCVGAEPVALPAHTLPTLPWTCTVDRAAAVADRQSIP